MQTTASWNYVRHSGVHVHSQHRKLCQAWWCARALPALVRWRRVTGSSKSSSATQAHREFEVSLCYKNKTKQNGINEKKKEILFLLPTASFSTASLGHYFYNPLNWKCLFSHCLRFKSFSSVKAQIKCYLSLSLSTPQIEKSSAFWTPPGFFLVSLSHSSLLSLSRSCMCHLYTWHSLCRRIPWGNGFHLAKYQVFSHLEGCMENVERDAQ